MEADRNQQLDELDRLAADERISALERLEERLRRELDLDDGAAEGNASPANEA